MLDKIIIIAGPTAVGKTELSLELAEKFSGEIVSGDSMQIYRDLDIGTAKVTREEAGDIPHHLINLCDIQESFSVAEFQREARRAIQEILQKNKLPIVVGGTGLYLESLLFDVSYGEGVKEDPAIRSELEDFAKSYGAKQLWERLAAVDAVAAERIHPNNVQRVVRALEVYEVSGKKFSEMQDERQQKNKLYDAFIIGLNTKRELLYDRINERVEQMMVAGLEAEACYLFKNSSKDATARAAIGYKEFFPYFEGEITKDEVVRQIQQNSRRYAKRQLTWFRNRLKVDHWYDLIQHPSEMQQIEKDIKRFIGSDTH